jgi:hypothetical protein
VTTAIGSVPTTRSEEFFMRARIVVTLFAWLFLGTAPAAFGGVNAWTLHGPVDGGGAVSAVAVHPTDGLIALAATPRGIFRSSDGAQTWAPAGGELRSSARRIIFDPSNPNRVVACDGRLYLSSNAGQTFGVLPGPNTPDGILYIAFAKDGTLYALSSMGALFKAAPPFASWISLAGGWPGGSTPNMLATDPSNAQILYASFYQRGVYRSDTGGTGWTLLDGGLPPASSTAFTGLDVDPTNSSRLLLASTAGIFLSTDSGTSWTTQYVSAALWVGFDPEDPDTALAVGYSNVFRSADRGQSWTQVWAHRNESTANAGFIPGNAGGVLLALSAGIAYSNNNGSSFDYHNTGLAGFSSRLLVASDDAVYAAMAIGFADVYRRNGSNYAPLDYLQTYPATGDQRLFTSLAVAAGDSNQIFAVNLWSQLIRTFDRGASWSGAHPAFLPSGGDNINDVQIDPGNPQVAYVGRKLTGVWKTEDGGNLFTRLANSPNYIGKLAVSPHDGSVYASSGPNNQSGIYKSSDGGATWVEQLGPLSFADRSFVSFTFHPVNPQVVYAVGPGVQGNVWRTINGGTSWQPVSLASSGEGILPAYSLLLDPLLPTTMFLVSTSSAPGFMRSVDGGVTWEKTPISVPGTPTGLGTAVLDPANPSTLIATTSGAGIAEYQVSPDLGLAMSTISSPLATSGTASATFTVNNLGPHASSASELQIDVPAWLTPTATGCTRNAQTLRCPLGAMQVNASRSVQVSFAVGASPQSTGNINATLTGHETDSQTANNTAGQNVTAAEIADLDVAITGTAVVDRGGDTNVTVNVDNSGPSPSTVTHLTLQLPANLSASNVVASQGHCTAGAGTLDCNMGTLGTNASAHVALTLHADAPGEGTLSAEASGAGEDPDSSHTASRVFTVRPVGDMAVTLSESADPVTVDAAYQYDATVTNKAGDAGAFTVTIPITGAAVTSANANFGSCSISGTTVTCAGLGLSAGGAGNIAIGLVSGAPGIATATATVDFAGTDTDPANNSASIGTALRLVGDVSVDIVDNTDPVALGVPYTYTVTVRNAGPNAGAVQVILPATGATISAASSTSFNCTHSTGAANCNVASLDKDASAVITVTAVAAATGPASLGATAIFGGVDTNTANDQASASTTAVLMADISVELADSIDPAVAGGPLTYTATLHNHGPNAGTVRVSIDFTGATVATITPSAGGSCTTLLSQSRAECTFTSLASGGATTAAVSLTSAAGRVDGIAQAFLVDGTDPVITDNHAAASTTVNAAPSSSSSGGGGGGGSFDWLAAGLLGLLLAGRQLRRPVVLRADN